MFTHLYNEVTYFGIKCVVWNDTIHCNTHLCSCELVSKEGIGGEREEGDQYWSGGPEIDTHGI